MPPAAEPAVPAELPDRHPPWVRVEFALLLLGSLASAALELFLRVAS